MVNSLEADSGHATHITLRGRHVHFVGIGGCGMSGLARLTRAHGAICTGSDQQRSPSVESLVDEGFDVSYPQTAKALPEASELVVISAAIAQDHPEVVEARRRNIQIIKYAQLLGRLMAAGTGVAVAGTHGKSTTTSMLCHVLIQCGLDPSFIVGANCPQIGGGWRCARGKIDREHARASSDILVAEACEYDRSFHHFTPQHGLILNVESDHLDMYADLSEIIESFADFARRIRSASNGGSLLINHEMSARLEITGGLDCEIQTIGFSPQADWQVRMEPSTPTPHPGLGPNDDKANGQPTPHDSPTPPNPPTRRRVELVHRGQTLADWAGSLPGEHMAYNAAAAAITARRLGADWPGIAKALESFQGVERRMQVVGGVGGMGGPDGAVDGANAVGRDGDRQERRGEPARGEYRNPPNSAPTALPPCVSTSLSAIPILDDYGHHPTEIDATLRAIRGHFRPQRVICVFQPHQHSRTRFLLDQFARSFTNSDVVLVPEIYFVRDSEHERASVTAEDLVERLREQGVDAQYRYPFAAIVDQVRALVRPGDLVVTMGAGDVWRIAQALAEPRDPVPQQA